MRVLSVLGGRPHLVKAESVHRAFVSAAGFDHMTVECWYGRHSDYPNRGDHDFDLPQPIVVIHKSATRDLAAELDSQLAKVQPDAVLVYGDLRVTSIGAALAVARGMPVVHIEAGYRSGDPKDREEETRILVDHASQHRIAFSPAMQENLLAEGIHPRTISVYGDCALQTLNRRLTRMADQGLPSTSAPNRGLITFHRAENLRTRERTRSMIEYVKKLSNTFEIHLIAYGLTRKALTRFGVVDELRDCSIEMTETLPYDQYVRELLDAAFVITDSSGLQDECAFLQKPCFVLRTATPRRERLGKLIRLCPPSGGPDALVAAVTEAVAAQWTQGPDLSLLGREYDRTFLDVLLSLT